MEERMVSSQDWLVDLADDPWFGSAIELYSRRDLVHAGLRMPLTGRVRESRDHPARFYGPSEAHPFVRFTAHEDIDIMRLNAAEGNGVVLVAMGSYAPMHHGHISMMEAAEAAVAEEGDRAVAAVFSLHSEEHVRAKIIPTRPNAPIATETRRTEAERMCSARLSSGTPAFVDTWDASMPGGPRSFTDVIRRLMNTLSSFEIRNVTPVAVFGSDNGVSMRAFANFGRCICVVRPGHEHVADGFLAEPQMRNAVRERRALVTVRPNGGGDISSSMIRAARV